jgi:uncharacterized protein (TIGR02996 family)
MPSDEAFLHAICENPQDDAPRLIYADWLEEHGKPERAEFIRVDVELARLDEDDPRWPALAARGRELLERHGDEWRRLPNLPGIRWGRWERGFVVEARAAHAKAFLENAATLFRVTPLRRLEFGARVTARTLARILAVPELARLDHLALWRSPLETAGAEAVARSPHLAGLSTLSLGQCRLGSGGVAALAAAPHLRRLRRLWLWGNQVGDDGARALAESPVLATVSDLALNSNEIGDAGVRALAESPFLGRLAFLQLNDNQFGDEGVRALTASDGLPELAVLYLVGNRITDDGTAALAASPLSERLAELHLGWNRVTRAGARALASAAWPRLRHVSVIDYNRHLGEEGAAALRERFGERVKVLPRP